jgi:hypothetical protein
MKSIIFGLSIVSAASAQIVNGVSMVAVPMLPSSSAPGSSSTFPTPTPTPVNNGDNLYGGSYTPTSASPSQYTTPPVYSLMPYSSFMAGGYKSMNCGYGYSKASDGSCHAESWWSTTGCYETIIVNNRVGYSGYDGYGGSGSSCDVSTVTAPVRFSCRRTLVDRYVSEDVWKASPQTVTAG